MSSQVWILIAVVVIVAIIVAYQRSRQNQVQQTRDLRMGAQEQGQAQSPSEEISQREERRLTGMSTEDRDWEQASLQRNRDIQDERTRQVQGSEDLP
jgi:5-methylcytosine-specific restriction endonuclease McrA